MLRENSFHTQRGRKRRGEFFVVSWEELVSNFRGTETTAIRKDATPDGKLSGKTFLSRYQHSLGDWTHRGDLWSRARKGDSTNEPFTTVLAHGY